MAFHVPTNADDKRILWAGIVANSLFELSISSTENHKSLKEIPKSKPENHKSPGEIPSSPGDLWFSGSDFRSV